jgi:hypothetical protein
MMTIVDTDAILGIVNSKDALHDRAKHAVEELAKRDFIIFVLPTTSCEFATIATIRLGFEPAKQALRRMMQQAFFAIRCDR